MTGKLRSTPIEFPDGFDVDTADAAARIVGSGLIITGGADIKLFSGHHIKPNSLGYRIFLAPPDLLGNLRRR